MSMEKESREAVFQRELADVEEVVGLELDAQRIRGGGEAHVIFWSQGVCREYPTRIPGAARVDCLQEVWEMDPL